VTHPEQPCRSKYELQPQSRKDCQIHHIAAHAPSLHGLAWTSEQAVSTFPTSADPTTEVVSCRPRSWRSRFAKKVGSLEAVRACLAQIGKVNPRLNAVVQLCEERAVIEASDADTLLAKADSKARVMAYR
jgi:hypothetical protein